MELKHSQIEAAVEKILWKVVGKLEAAGLAGWNGEGNTGEEPNPILVLIPQTATSVPEILCHISGKNPGRGMTRAAGDTSRKLKIFQDLHRYEKVYCVSPGMKFLEDISLGIDEGTLESAVIKALLLKKQVHFVVDYEVQGFSAGPLLKKAGKLLEAVRAQGIEVETIWDGEEGRKPQPSKERRLVTEEDIQTLWNKGIKQVSRSKDCIITPLARDKANELDIKLL